MKIYIAYSRHKPYLPIAVADTAAELAAIMGTTKNTVESSISHKIVTYAKVEVK